MGLGLGLALATALALGNGGLPRLFTGDAAVLAAVGHIFPWVILSQPINALAFVWDGILYGAGGFSYAAKVRLPAFIHSNFLWLPTASGHAESISIPPDLWQPQSLHHSMSNSPACCGCTARAALQPLCSHAVTRQKSPTRISYVD